MLRDLLLGKKPASQSQSPSQSQAAGLSSDDEALWPTIIVVALIVTVLLGLFVFVGSLPSIHERQKNEAIQNGTLRK